MGPLKTDKSTVNFNFLRNNHTSEIYNSKVALWHLPDEEKYYDFDFDGSKWLESCNKNKINEIAEAEKHLNTDLDYYKVYVRTVKNADKSSTETSKYPNGNQVKVIRHPSYVLVEIEDKERKLIAEKCYNYSSNEGRKTVYKYCKQGDNLFTVVRIFSYDKTKNKSTDIVNFGYTSFDSDFTEGCTFEKEYYMLNGKEVKAEINDNFEYSVVDKQGKILTFGVE